MTRIVSSSCPEPQTDFNKLHAVFAHTTTVFKTLLYGFKATCIMSKLKWYTGNGHSLRHCRCV